MRYEILDKIGSPADVKKLTGEQLERLAAEIRDRMIDVTSNKGGHLAASLGTVEITLALHYVLSSPADKIIWDVGHQTYAHKMITGRNKQFDTLREMGGLSGFPSKYESEHDIFTAGHSGTSISSAIGLATARDLKGEDHRVVAVIGDASLGSGLAFEGMNYAGHARKNMAIILNDNEHAISRPVGAMSRYLNKVITNPLYNRVRDEAEKAVKNIPRLGPKALASIKRFQEGLKNLIVPGAIFEEMGFRYFGPVDGHNVQELINIFQKTLSMKEPVFIHVVTKKGKGYKFAEDDPINFHGVTSFDVETGQMYSDYKGKKTFTQHFGETMTRIAAADPKVVAVTAAMKDGVGLDEFSKKFPARLYDVGITEPHAVTFAAGLARGGLKPVVAVYSTFLQRSYDQMIHDVALQSLPVVFCLDRAGLVGKDGPTHHGVFDIAYTRPLPHFVVMAPKDGLELEMMMEKALECGKPVVIRYPRDFSSQRIGRSSYSPIMIGKAEKLREGKHLAIIAIGSMVNTALSVADILSGEGVESCVVNARFIKPLDEEMLENILNDFKKVITIEEGVLDGGFGGAVLEFAAKGRISGVRVKCLGLPDEFIEHGDRETLLRKYHLTPREIAETIRAEVLK